MVASCILLAAAIGAVAVALGRPSFAAGPALGDQAQRFAVTRRVIVVEARLANHRGNPVQGVGPGQLAVAVDGLACPRLTAEWIAAPASVPRQRSVAAKRRNSPSVAAGAAVRSSIRVVLLIDFVNTAPADRMRLLTALRALLDAPALAGNEVELATLVPPVEIVRGFTDDTAALRRAVARLYPLAAGPGPPAAFQYDPQLLGGGPMGDAARRQLAFFDHVRSAATLAGFRRLAAALAKHPGRKIVVWLTADPSALNPSFAFQFSLANPAQEPIGIPAGEYSEVFRGLNTADASVWPLELRGVSNPGMVGASSSAGDPRALQLFQEDRAGAARLAMFTMAEGTGGRVFEGSNDLVGLLRRALALAQGYYLLTCPFTLAAKVPHGHALRSGTLLLAPGYHRIRVKVARRGVQVLARRGVLIAARP